MCCIITLHAPVNNSSYIDIHIECKEIVSKGVKQNGGYLTDELKSRKDKHKHDVKFTTYCIFNKLAQIYALSLYHL